MKTAVDIPKLHAKFTGTGDLFTALFLAWMTELDNISIALEITVSTVHTILRKTINDLQGEKNLQIYKYKILIFKKFKICYVKKYICILVLF